jgi:hypothetical protein
MAAVDRVTVHHQGAGAPSDDFGYGSEGYCAGIGATRWQMFRAPADAFATKHYNGRSFDICLSGNRNNYPVTDFDLQMISEACADARARGWLRDDAVTYPHGTLHAIPPGYPPGNMPTECPGTGTVGDRWPDVVHACAGSAPAPIEEGQDDMRALRTVEDGGIYVFGPGIFELCTGPSWGAWERFTGPALEVNAAQRDMIRSTCLGAGAACWNYPLRSRIDGEPYAAGDILTSAEQGAQQSR